MTPKTSSFSLVERFRAGDAEAFAPLFEKNRRRLAVLIHYKMSAELRSSVEVDDLVQETFFAASRDIHAFEYRSPGSFMRWLAGIASHVVVDAARRRGRVKRPQEQPLSREPRDSRTPSRILRENERVGQLMDKIQLLPEDYRQAILWAKIEGCTTQELAERFGKSREAASLLLHRAVKRLRELQ